jgi:hypothetical protein
LGALEGLLVNLCRDLGRSMTVAQRPVARAPQLAAQRPRTLIGTTHRTRTIVLAALVALALLTGSSAAQASEASKIIEKCGHGEPFGGYSQKAYREALKQLPTEVSEYSPCANLISKDELAKASGSTSAATEAVSSNVPLPLTPSEQNAVQNAHSHGSTPVRVGGEPIRPGVVHANIASAASTLPSSLLAVLAFMFAGAVALTVGEVSKRVRAHRHG